jgi:magnesium-transporting ATPase (P-type)
LFAALHASPNSLQKIDPESRLNQYGPNTLIARRQTKWFGLLLRQCKRPLVLILVFASIVSAFVGEWIDAIIILAGSLAARRLSLSRNIEPVMPWKNYDRK